MTKKIFAQPEMMVVNVKRNDIITGSTEKMGMLGDYNSGSVNIAAPGQRGLNDYYEGY